VRRQDSIFYKTGLAVGLATFLISNAQANPFYVQPLKTGYGNTETGGTTGKNSAGPVTPHSYEDDMTGAAPDTQGPAVASESDSLGDYSAEPDLTETDSEREP
jgi:hypothetical protein